MGDVNHQEEITEADVLAKLRELLKHGFGRLEVVVRDNKISKIDWTASLIAKPVK